jgi:hypothetical protein
VVEQLGGVAASVRILRLPGLREKGDVSDWIGTGGTRDELERLAAECHSEPLGLGSSEGNPGEGSAESTREPKQNQAQLLIAVAQDRAEFFRSEEDGETYASFLHDGVRVSCAVASRFFKAFLVRAHLEVVGRPPSTANVSEAAITLDTMAVFDAPTLPVALRVGGHPGDRLYLDLGDSTWKVVETSCDGWLVKDAAESSIRFRRSATTRPLPVPAAGGSPDDLRPFINYETEDDWRLLLSYLLFCFQPRGPFPVLVMQGEHGSAKSTTTKVLRRLVDPSQYPLLRFSGRPDDFFYFAEHSALLALDNLSGLSKEASDALCGVSTGTGDARRKLYTDDELHGFNGCRPVILNGIDDMATRADLASRTITIKLPAIDSGRRRQESQFWQAFEEAHPKILGALLSALSATLRTLPAVTLGDSPRMADFARFGAAVERALGWPACSFANAYRSNQRQTEESAVEADAVASAIDVELLEKFEGRWEGSMQDLLRDLNVAVPNGPRDRTWPTSPRQLSSRLERIKPLLRSRDIAVSRGQRSRQLRPWIIERQEDGEGRGRTTVTTVTPSPEQPFRAAANDGHFRSFVLDDDPKAVAGDGRDGVGLRQDPTVTGGSSSLDDVDDVGDGRLTLSNEEGAGAAGRHPTVVANGTEERIR